MSVMTALFFGLLVSLVSLSSAQESSPSTTQHQWDKRYTQARYIYGKEPVGFLKEHVGALGAGKALCLAAGEGRNAVFLAQPATNRFGPRNPACLVKPNELLPYFSAHRVRYYEDTIVPLDEGMHQGAGAIIRLIIEK